ncbi:MAG: lipid II:glycine glycyltransferase FemX [Pseudanabaena sp.]|uniref:lipid II:glycine glycyltransferase FemX n=1 Tax=Pseudanabaena mucicola TaxID=71190 RepID=UPI00257669B7|nr:peptidoglycan bridge formation glycyltransferase FemA/FemB family protein [Pseudanabaena mucicola]
MILRELLDGDRRAWDKLTQTYLHGCFMQSWAWANFRELDGYQTFRYGLFDELNQLIGGCIFYFYPQRSAANLIFAPAAPLLPPNLETEGMRLLLNQAEKLSKGMGLYGAIALRIEPLLSKKPDWMGQDFRRSPADIMPSETLWIDLSQSEAEIFAQMHAKGRYNIRLSQRYAVETIFTKEDTAIPHFYDLFYETAQRQGFLSEPYGYFIKLCQNLFRENMAEIGFAKYNGEILAAILLIYWGERCTYLYGGRSERAKQVMPVYALHWAAIQRAKQLGYRIYDFYGFSDDPTHAYYQFSRFKVKFGGKITKTIGAHDYFFYDCLADVIMRLLR